MSRSTVTINEFLGRPNPKIELLKMTSGWNTSHEKWIPVEGIRELKGFTYTNLYNTYKDDLKKPMSSHADIDLQKLVALGRMGRVANEDSLTLLSAISVCLPANLGLQRVAAPSYIGAGSLFYSNLDAGGPDLGIGYYSEKPGEQVTANECPGDFKISSKWTSEGLLDPRLDVHNPDSQLRNQLRPLEQIQHYCSAYSRPWGFLLTNKELVIVRISFSPTTLRSPNAPRGTSHQRSLSDTSVLSSDVSSMSLDGSLYSGGSDGSSLGPIEICSIPWSASGDKIMTLNRGLWYLARLVERRDSISEWYPPLDPKASASRPSKGLTLASEEASLSKIRGSESKVKGGKDQNVIFVPKKGIDDQVMEKNFAVYFTGGTFEKAMIDGTDGYRISYPKGGFFFKDFLRYMRHDTATWLATDTARYEDSAACRRREQLKTSEL